MQCRYRCIWVIDPSVLCGYEELNSTASTLHQLVRYHCELTPRCECWLRLERLCCRKARLKCNLDMGIYAQPQEWPQKSFIHLVSRGAHDTTRTGVLTTVMGSY